MSPHAVTHQLPRIKLTAELKQFAVTSNAFLPEHSPLKQFPDPYYQPWELVIQHVAPLIQYNDIRRAVDTMPVLGTDRLKSEPEWRRAYSVLAFLTHAYVWGGEKPAEVSSFVHSLVLFVLIFYRFCLLRSQSPSSPCQNVSNFLPFCPMPQPTSGTFPAPDPTFLTSMIFLLFTPLQAQSQSHGFSSSASPWKHAPERSFPA